MKVIVGDFEKYLSLWVLITIIFGVICGQYFPTFFTKINDIEYYNINLVIAILTWILIYPMMLSLNFVGIKEVFKNKRAFSMVLGLNWVVTPILTMIIPTLFFKYLYSGIYPPDLATGYLAGVILISLTPCSATIIIWSRITKSNINFTVTQIVINTLAISILYAPFAKFLLKTANIEVPMLLLFIFTMIYLIIPLIFAKITKIFFKNKIVEIDDIFKFLSSFALLAIVFLSFAFQSQMIIDSPMVIVLISIPMLIQTYLLFYISYFAGIKMKLPFDILTPASLIAASNFFEFSVAISISLFGLNSPATMAAAVGVITEVPVMISLIKICKKGKTPIFNRSHA